MNRRHEFCGEAHVCWWDFLLNVACGYFSERSINIYIFVLIERCIYLFSFRKANLKDAVIPEFSGRAL